jgi:hypothetical protein
VKTYYCSSLKVLVRSYNSLVTCANSSIGHLVDLCLNDVTVYFDFCPFTAEDIVLQSFTSVKYFRTIEVTQPLFLDKQYFMIIVYDIEYV